MVKWYGQETHVDTDNAKKPTFSHLTR